MWDMGAVVGNETVFNHIVSIEHKYILLFFFLAHSSALVPLSD